MKLTTTQNRVAANPVGSHPVSGSWISETAYFPENMRTFSAFTFKGTANSLTYSDPLGRSYEANFDGKDYPAKGDRIITTVSLTKVNDSSFDATFKQLSGKIAYVEHWTMSADGKIVNIKEVHETDRMTMTYAATKQ